jgi:zinc transport system substrate-binding protein
MICGVFAVAVASGCEAAREPVTPSEADAQAARLDTSAPMAVSSPYLEAAVRDVVPKEGPMIRLAGPAMCPGHFDMRPSQISDLAGCRLLVRFDFQQALDEKLDERRGSPLPTLAVRVPGGMCEPDAYLAACRQIADHFVSRGELTEREAEDRLTCIAQRAELLRRTAAQKIDAAGLRNAPVLASRHQAAFCGWLGLRVVSTFSGSDTAGTREIDQAVSAGEAAKARVIVANEPEGRKLADALADRLKARVVVFANFPEPGQEHAFDALVQRNLAALLAAAPAIAEQP